MWSNIGDQAKAESNQRRTLFTVEMERDGCERDSRGPETIPRFTLMTCDYRFLLSHICQ